MLTDIRYINKSAYDAITDPAKVNIVSVSGGKDSTALLTYAVNLGVPFQAVFADVIDRVEKWEQLVSSSAKQGKATFFTIDGLQGDGIRDRVSWSYTSYGGRQIDLFRLMDDVPVCSSQYGLCE